jgi:hypothetical protein
MDDDDEKLVSHNSSLPTTLVGPYTQLPTTQRSSSYPTSRLSVPFEPVNQIEAIKDSDRMLGAVARGKLQLITEQIENLKKQARDIIMKAEVDMRLHRAICSFEKRVGHTYYLYEKNEEENYFSMLSPQDWRGHPPHRFLGAYKLESDQSWLEVSLFHTEKTTSNA